MTRGRIHHAMALLALVSFVVACGGGGDDADPVVTEAAGDTVDDAGGGDDTTDTIDDATEDATGSATSGDTGDASGSYEPGDIGFRVVNGLDRPVDLWVRTTGLVEAYPVMAGLEPGEVSDLAAPPAEGRFVVTEAGAGDATCVVDCDHFLAELSAFPDEGPVRTVFLYRDDSGADAAYELWEQPDESRAGNANAMPSADPSTGLVVVLAVAVSDADFGLRLSFDGTPGCVDSVNLTGVLVGGNQTPAFAYPGDSAGILLHDNQDRECAEPAVGGPFTVAGGAGTRTLLFLSGAPGSMESLVLPMVGDEDAAAAGAAAGSGDADGGASGSAEDVDLAIDLIAAELVAETGLPQADAECVGGYIVDAIGTDVLLDGDQLVDLDGLPDELQAPTEAALAEALVGCGIQE